MEVFSKSDRAKRISTTAFREMQPRAQITLEKDAIVKVNPAISVLNEEGGTR